MFQRVRLVWVGFCTKQWIVGRKCTAAERLNRDLWRKEQGHSKDRQANGSGID